MSAPAINPEIVALARWMHEAVARTRFGDVRATIRIHEGRISLIERETVEKVKPTGPADDGDAF